MIKNVALSVNKVGISIKQTPKIKVAWQKIEAGGGFSIFRC
jgi:hypothetical protein